MKALHTTTIYELDRVTPAWNRSGVTPDNLALMNDAVVGISDFIINQISAKDEFRHIICCIGVGNNGFDALWSGWILEQSGYTVDYFAVAEEEKKTEEETAQADEVTEQTVAEQPKRPEPVMVHVPKKEKKQFAVPENKGRKSYKWLYAVLSVFAICAVLAVIYFVPSKQTETVAKEEVAVVEGHKADAVTGATVVEETVAKNEHKTDAVTGATVDATSGATPQNKELVSKEESLNELVAEEKVAEEYKFVVTEELASLDLKNVTVADTLQYEVAGVWVEHKVVAQETLTRIALKYYGDKKLWPYIVKYNSLTRPDDLRKGMKLLIPKLIPAN